MLQHTERVEYANLLETSGSQSHVYTNLEPHIYENVSSGGRRPDESADVASVSAAGLSKHSLVLSFSFEDVAVPLPATASFPTPLPSVSAAVAAAPAPVRCTQQIAQSNVVPSVRLETVVRQAPTRYYTLSLPQSPNPVRWRERYLRLHFNVNDVWTRLNRLLQLDYTFYALLLVLASALCCAPLGALALYELWHAGGELEDARGSKRTLVRRVENAKCVARVALLVGTAINLSLFVLLVLKLARVF